MTVVVAAMMMMRMHVRRRRRAESGGMNCVYTEAWASVVMAVVMTMVRVRRPRSRLLAVWTKTTVFVRVVRRGREWREFTSHFHHRTEVASEASTAPPTSKSSMMSTSVMTHSASSTSHDVWSAWTKSMFVMMAVVMMMHRVRGVCGGWRRTARSRRGSVLVVDDDEVLLEFFIQSGRCGGARLFLGIHDGSFDFRRSGANDDVGGGGLHDANLSYRCWLVL